MHNPMMGTLYQMGLRLKRCKWILIALLTIFVRGVSAQGFEQFLHRLESLPESDRAATVDSLLTVTKSFPIIEQDTVVHYIYNGPAKKVSVPGDVNGWKPDSMPMTQIGGTSLWYLTQNYPADARLEYKYVVDDTIWILDPRNSNQAIEGFGPNSELRMPEYTPPPEIEYYPNIAHGTVADTIWYSSNISNKRKIEVYLPAGYASISDSFPVVYFQDGSEAVSLEKAENIIDYLISKKLIRPVIAVFVPPMNRNAEYAGDQVSLFMNFFVDELVNFVDTHYRTVKNPMGRAVIGASFGGNISLWLAARHNEIFGNVAAQSSYVDPQLERIFQDGPMLNLKIHLDVGTYDMPELIPMVNDLHSILQARGYMFEYGEYHEGHSWGSWRARIRNALEFFFPAKG